MRPGGLVWGSAALPLARLGRPRGGGSALSCNSGGDEISIFPSTHSRAARTTGAAVCEGGAPPVPTGQDVPLTQSPTINGAIYIRPRVGVKVGISVPRELALYPSNYSPVPSLRLNLSVFEHPPNPHSRPTSGEQEFLTSSLSAHTQRRYKTRLDVEHRVVHIPIPFRSG